MKIRCIFGVGLLAALVASPAFAQQPREPDGKAVKICKDHPAWTAEECQDVADKKLWVGMPVEMVLAEKPKTCVKNPKAYRKNQPPNMLQFACFVQWGHAAPAHTEPFLLQLIVEDGRVSSIAYN